MSVLSPYAKAKQEAQLLALRRSRYERLVHEISALSFTDEGDRLDAFAFAYWVTMVLGLGKQKLARIRWPWQPGSACDIERTIRGKHRG